MVYDITDPAHAKFVNYINSREFDSAIQGDVSPEGLCFVPASENANGKALVLAACEVSGTLGVYACDYQGNSSNPHTGEDGNMELILSVMTISLALAAVLIGVRKKESRKYFD